MSINDRLADDAFKAMNKKHRPKKNVKRRGTKELTRRNAELRTDNNQVNKYNWKHF